MHYAYLLYNLFRFFLVLLSSNPNGNLRIVIGIISISDVTCSFENSGQKCNVSVNSKPDHPQGQFSRWANSPPPNKKKVPNLDPQAYKNGLNPTPGAFCSIIHCKNMKKLDRNHVKLQDFIIFRFLKDKLGLQLYHTAHF